MYAQFESLESRTLLSISPVLANPRPVLQAISAGGVNTFLSVGHFVADDFDCVPFGGSLYIRTDGLLWKANESTLATTQIAGDKGTEVHVDWAGTAGGNMYYISQSRIGAGPDYGYLYKLNASNNTWAAIAGIYGDLEAHVANNQFYLQVNHYGPDSVKYYSINGSTASEIGGIPAADPIANQTSLTIGSTQFYAHDDGVHGNELWKSDTSGAQLLRDIFPGTTSSDPQHMVAFGGELIFVSSIPGTIGVMGAGIIGRTLFVTGTLHDDKIIISSANGMTNMSVSFGPTGTETYDDDDFDQIYVAADWGQDLLDLSQTSKPAMIYGGSGNDTILSGTGNDTIDGGLQTDLLDDSRYTEAIVGNGTKLTIGTEVDMLIGIDSILCGSGDDTINVRAQGQTGIPGLTARMGYDSLTYIDGGVGDDHLSYYDSGENNPIAPTIHGGAGNDVISIARYGFFSDTLHSGGNAIYYGDDGDDMLEVYRTFCNRDFHGGNGIDTVDYRGFSTAGGLRITLDDQPGDGPYGTDNVHSDIEIIYGSVFDDTLIGSSHDDTLIGSTGRDLLIGNGGNDSIVGDQYDTILDVPPDDLPPYHVLPHVPLPPPPPVVTQSVVDPQYHLSNGVLTITGSDDSEVLEVRRKPTNLKVLEILVDGLVTRTFTAFKVDSLQLDALGGNDTVHLETMPIPAKIYGGDGDDVIYGTKRNDRISGGAGNDWISAGDGNDTLYGDAGNDKLFGGDGNDYINGGTGVDVIRSGAGRDRIIATIGLDDLRDNTGDLITNVV